MRKIELIAAISEESCLPRVEVEVTLETFFKIIKETVVNEETVTIWRFGTFTMKKSTRGKARNTQEKLAIRIHSPTIHHPESK